MRKKKLSIVPKQRQGNLITPEGKEIIISKTWNRSSLLITWNPTKVGT